MYTCQPPSTPNPVALPQICDCFFLTCFIQVTVPNTHFVGVELVIGNRVPQFSVKYYFSTEKCYFYCISKDPSHCFFQQMWVIVCTFGMFVKVRTLSVCTCTHTYAMKPQHLIALAWPFIPLENYLNHFEGKGTGIGSMERNCLRCDEELLKWNRQGSIHCSTAVQTALRIWCFQFKGKPKLVSQKREPTYKKQIYIFL